MNGKLILIFSIIIGILGSAFASQGSVSCDFVPSSECSGTVFFAVTNDDAFTDSSGEVLSANVATSSSANYDKVLCCDSPYGDFSAESLVNDSGNTCGEDIDLFYFSGSENARVSFTDERNDIVDYNQPESDLAFRDNGYNQALCVGIPDGFGSFDIVVSDKTNYGNIGYDCMFKVSSLANGVVSSCDAGYGSSDSEQYLYTVWGRMFESLASLECNSDCTSKLDGRVYSACSEKINSCSSLKSLGPACDGALLGSWVDYGDGENEVQCSPPWDNLRSKVFSEEKLDVSISEDSEVYGCDNLISKKQTVLLDNEQVTMSIYVCEE